jgi:predicted PurR-regulated permease PerM
MTDPRTAEARARTAMAVVVGLGLAVVLWLKLLGALIVALATHVVFDRLLQRLRRKLPPRIATAAAVVLTLLALALLGAAIAKAVSTLTQSGGGLPGLLDLLADVVDRIRSQLPAWISERLPQSMDELQHTAGAWLRAHAQSLQRVGENALRTAAHVLLGLVIGLLSAFEAQPKSTSRWADAAARSAGHVGTAFAAIVSAQLRIALVNTALTAVFLFGVAPLFGDRLPLSFALLALTFVTGLLPIVGNLVSNAALLLVALTVGPAVAIAGLVFLLAIHKLEYFLNAHFVGRSTRVPASWLLASMLLLEAAFGLPGLVAAPIYCAWLFAELRDGGVIA